MSWIDDRLADRKQLHERNAAVQQGAAALYQELWIQVRTWADEAVEKGIPVRINGREYIKTLSLSPKTAGSPKELHITLHKEREKITVHGSGVSLEFSIDICDDLVLCIKYGGGRIGIEDAARLILDPFLFPELQPKKTN